MTTLSFGLPPASAPAPADQLSFGTPQLTNFNGFGYTLGTPVSVPSNQLSQYTSGLTGYVPAGSQVGESNSQILQNAVNASLGLLSGAYNGVPGAQTTAGVTPASYTTGGASTPMSPIVLAAIAVGALLFLGGKL